MNIERRILDIIQMADKYHYLIEDEEQYYLAELKHLLRLAYEAGAEGGSISGANATLGYDFYDQSKVNTFEQWLESDVNLFNP